MTFDSNRAWQRASAAIRANREVLFALAGVFYLLPMLAFSLLFPQPTPPPGADEAAMVAFATRYYAETMPVAIPMALIQAAGTLGLLTLMTDRSRPTVGQAIRTGFATLPIYIAAQLVLGLGLGLVAMVVLTVLGISGSKAVVTAGFFALVLAGIYVWVRTSLSAPVVAVERMRNPVRALTRSWALTAGNGWRILVFYALILLVFLIVLSLVMALVGIVLAVVLPTKPAAIIATVLASGLQAGMGLLLVAAMAATHAQLAGEDTEQPGGTFDFR